MTNPNRHIITPEERGRKPKLPLNSPAKYSVIVEEKTKTALKNRSDEVRAALDRLAAAVEQ